MRGKAAINPVGDLVLDAACRTGKFTSYSALMIEGEVIGFDYSRKTFGSIAALSATDKITSFSGRG
jgi:ubiquinone/menaquinone biosynthesis C-methylase UbiE